jgi:hypothetical protein
MVRTGIDLHDDPSVVDGEARIGDQESHGTSVSETDREDYYGDRYERPL